MRCFWKRITTLFGAARADHELQREIESHLQILQDQFEREFEKGASYPSRLELSRTAYDTDVTDTEWEQLAPLVPAAKPAAVRRSTAAAKS
jgi:hypothetical protein